MDSNRIQAFLREQQEGCAVDPRTPAENLLLVILEPIPSSDKMIWKVCTHLN